MIAPGGLNPGRDPVNSDPRLPLLKLSAIGQKMDSLRRFLSDAVDRHVPIPGDQIQMVSSEIASAVREIIFNGAALLASSHSPNPPPAKVVAPIPAPDPAASNCPEPCSVDQSADSHVSEAIERPVPPISGMPLDLVAENDEDCDIVEIDAGELLAEHVHFCEICGKGFKRDANLRMHMRAHGNRFKTLEALLKPERDHRSSTGYEEMAFGRKVRFSCPFVGCNRNRAHKKFRSLKSAVCVKNHFKRSHCPKMYTCHRCNKKSFSVVTDLRSHIKHCGENRWRCSCGTSFSRKDKLFGHIALFEGHMPAVGTAEEGKRKGVILGEEEEKEEGEGTGRAEPDGKGFDPEFFKELIEEFDEIERANWEAYQQL